jgi:putative DNA primase/helicase
MTHAPGGRPPGDRDPINFAELNGALLDRAATLVPQWLPGGTTRGHEYVCADLGGGPGSSCSVNLNTGQWADFSGDERGGDLVSLYAAIHNLNQGQAARQLMQDLGWQRSSSTARPTRMPAHVQTSGDMGEEPPPADENEGARVVKEKKRSIWKAITPVPDHAPEPPNVFRYYDRQASGWVEWPVARSWLYEFEGQRLGYVCRFNHEDGSKDTLPLTWCEDQSDGRGTQQWRWKQWEEPRPLYVPAALLSGDPANVPVVLVEGEKCAEAGHKLLGHEFDFVSWPGGGKAVNKASWGWLMGRTVYLWPDCDAKRERLSKAEREQGVDPATKPLLPEHKQPGVQAMTSVGSTLMADHGCTVHLCVIPMPGDVSDGWDIADAIEQGWDVEMVRNFIRRAVAFVPPDDAARAKAASTPSRAGADQEDLPPSWRDALLKSAQTGAIKAIRENVVLALDGMPARGLRGIPEAQGVIAFNELANDVVKLQESPWGTPAGAWAEVDDLLLGEWLVREHWLPSMPRGTLEESVRMVAYRHRYHPVRAWLETLRWDKTPRLSTWLRRVCLEEDEYDPNDPLQRYLARVGTFFVMAMCARVMSPGVKFDYMLILEGMQGLRKSTLLRTLAGDYFADTGLVLGDKDSYQQLQGVWLYEIPELDAFSKADVMKIKAYVASQEDYFRASFDRRAAKYPRQVVFAGTTNEDHYLTDPTGNRRFWPVRVTRHQVDIEWVQEHREQLFAEALVRWQAGRRMYPTPEEELLLFAPQQQHRAVENAIESAIARYLYPTGTPGGPNSDGALIDEISLVELLGKVGIGIEKLGPGRFHEKQAAAALRRLGWQEGRSTRPPRPRVYRRPSERPASGSQGLGPDGPSDSAERSADDCPF